MTKDILLKLPPELVAQVDSQAKKSYKTRTAYIRDILIDAVSAE